MQTLHTCLAGLVRQRGLTLVNLLCGSMHHDKTWDKEELPVLAETCCFKCFDVLPLERAKKRLNVCLFFSKMPPHSWPTWENMNEDAVIKQTM